MRKLLSLIVCLLILTNAVSFVSAATTTKTLEITTEVTPSTVSPGNEGYIEFVLTNTGTESISDIEIESLRLDSSISLKTLVMKDLGSLGAGKSTSFIVKFSVPLTASSGFYTALFKIEVCYDSVCRDYAKHAIIVVQAPSTLEITSVSPTSLRVGEQTSLNFTLTNLGEAPINNIVFSWQSSSNSILSVGSDNRVFISEMNAYESRKISSMIAVSPDITLGVYPISIKMSYVDQVGSPKNISSTVGIIIGGLTDFDVVVQDSTATSTTLAIANIGANTAYSVIVKIPEQENFRATGTSANIMGNLDAGDYTLASFQITPTRTATNISVGREKNLVVEISYTDMLGMRRTVQKEVRLDRAGIIEEGTKVTEEGTKVYPVQRGQLQIPGGSGLMYIGIGIVGIIVIVFFFKFRKRKKK